MAEPENREFLDSAVLSRLTRLTVPARAPMLGSVTGIHRSATRGSSVEFAEYRKYVPGDDVRHVDWRVFARTDRFYMKEFEADTNLRCMIMIDTSASMGFTGANGSKFDYARRLAATLAYLMVHQGDAVGLTAFSDRTLHEISPRHSPSHLRNIFDTLSGLTPAGRSHIVETLHATAERVQSRALVILISDLFTDVEPLLDGLQHMRFRKHDTVVFHLLDRRETNFTFDRPIRFMDMESPFSLITDPTLVESDYRDAMSRYLKTIQHGCRQFDVDYQEIFTDTDYEKVLAAFLLQRLGKAKGTGRRS